MAAQLPPPDQADARGLQIRLSTFLDQARALSDGLDPLVSRYELKTSEFLFGLIGALILMLICIILFPQINSRLGREAVPLIVGTSVLLGIALGLTVFRGPSRWRMERNLRKLSLQLEALRTEVKTLDGVDGRPGTVATQLWSAYEESIAAYRQVEQFSYRASKYPFVLLNRRN